MAIRDLTVAAPLKLGRVQAGELTCEFYPRPHGRGPIEAIHLSS